MVLLRIMEFLGIARSIRICIAREVKKTFDDVNWKYHSFTINEGSPISTASGETKFYEAKEIDAAIKRLNKILNSLNA